MSQKTSAVHYNGCGNSLGMLNLKEALEIRTPQVGVASRKQKC